VVFQKAPDIQKKIKPLVSKLKLLHIDSKKIVAFRSFGSRSRARARIWSFPRIWQKALNISPHYCIEVLAEKFDSLTEKEKTMVLIHELLHIPKNFSGALLPHRGRGRRIDRREVERFFKMLKK
jgi:predicted metallopeptidase